MVSTIFSFLSLSSLSISFSFSVRLFRPLLLDLAPFERNSSSTPLDFYYVARRKPPLPWRFLRHPYHHTKQNAPREVNVSRNHERVHRETLKEKDTPNPSVNHPKVLTMHHRPNDLPSLSRNVWKTPEPGSPLMVLSKIVFERLSFLLRTPFRVFVQQPSIALWRDPAKSFFLMSAFMRLHI